MKKTNIKKLALAGIFIALGVVGGSLSIPVGVSKCSPVQHMINVLCGVTLGPAYGVACAFATSLFRNLLGTGTLLAYFGSMVGAFLAGLMYRKTNRITLAMLGEVVGTGLIGAMLCYPVAKFLLGNTEAALFTFVLPFGVSTLGGSIIAGILLFALQKTHVLGKVLPALER